MEYLLYHTNTTDFVVMTLNRSRRVLPRGQASSSAIRNPNPAHRDLNIVFPVLLYRPISQTLLVTPLHNAPHVSALQSSITNHLRCHLPPPNVPRHLDIQESKSQQECIQFPGSCQCTSLSLGDAILASKVKETPKLPSCNYTSKYGVLLLHMLALGVFEN